MSEKIRWFFAKTLKDSVLLSKLYNTYFRVKNKKKFLDAVSERSKMNIFDIEKLAAELPYYPIEEVKDSNFYGYAYHIKKYAGIEKLCFSLEHGLYNDEYISPHNYLKTTKGILTFNQTRCDLLIEKTNKPSYAIGPYIHYANSLLNDDEIMSYKKELGKVLLFFPSHSTGELTAEYNDDAVINEVKQFAKEHGFDTVLVNLFYYDVLYKNYADAYRNAGFKLSTAGHRYDLNFVSRLKSIIMLSDYVVGNDFGTNIGYCIYLNKPFYILKNNMLDGKKGMFRQIGDIFTSYSESITKEQYDMCAKYWGFNSIKNKEELKSIINK